MQHISFDLETLGIDPAAMILSIGAVKFDPETKEIGDYFSRIIDITAPGGGGVIDASTVVWWMNQSQDARDLVFSTDPDLAGLRIPLRQALVEFSEFIGFTDALPDGEYPDVTLWQRGDKDAQWLASAYQGMQLKTPFNYWQVKDQRTLCSLFKPFMPRRQDDITVHDSLSDAFYQAHCLVHAFARLRETGAILTEVEQAQAISEPVVAPSFDAGTTAAGDVRTELAAKLNE
ncbi:hypothetical protein D3C81_1115610 [compost metagenome]